MSLANELTNVPLSVNHTNISNILNHKHDRFGDYKEFLDVVEICMSV